MLRTAFIAAALACASPAMADEPKLLSGITCTEVRAKVAELGKIKALALALENGATFRQIREARRCLAH